MYFILDKDEKVLGKGCIVVLRDNIITKYHFRSHLADYSILKSVNLLKLYDTEKELFVDYKRNNIFNEVVLNYIESTDPLNKTYAENIKVYLKLIDIFGFQYCKGDLTYYNILYRKSDDKPFIIDWDHYVDLNNSEEESYNFYKSELTSYKWQRGYGMNKEQVTEIFEKEWKNV